MKKTLKGNGRGNEVPIREINVKLITEKVRDLCMEANVNLGDDVLQAFDRAMKTEESKVGIDILEELKENARIAKEEKVRTLDRGSRFRRTAN